MEVKRRQPIGVELVKRGIVKEGDIENALAYQRQHPNRKIGDVLYLLDVCDPLKLIETIGEILGTKGMLLTPSSIKIKPMDYISFDIAKKNKVIPFEVVSGKIKVCFASNAQGKEVDSIRMLLLNKGLVMEQYISFESNIERTLKSLEGSATRDFNVISGSNDTITSLVDSIIKTGIERRASDIHIEPMLDQVRIRYRIDR
jgi:type IV pilus assembly protein PilB